MKKAIFIISFIIIGLGLSAQCYWSPGTGGIYYNGGNVGIGVVNNGVNRLEVSGRIGVTVPDATTSTGGTATSYGVSVSNGIDSTVTIRTLGSGIVHIATDSPGREIRMGGGLFEQTLVIKAGGKVGIGTTAPVCSLQIISGGQGRLALGKASSSDFTGWLGEIVMLGGGTGSEYGHRWREVDTGYGLDLRLDRKSYNNWTIDVVSFQGSTGNVGIGTTTPQYKLDVNGNAGINGTLKAQEIVVQSNIYADHVFSNDYSLTPINVVSEYIRENQHLPGIPTQDMALANGVDVGEYIVLLLEKVEELTLYIIDLEERLSALEKE